MKHLNVFTSHKELLAHRPGYGVEKRLAVAAATSASRFPTEGEDEGIWLSSNEVLSGVKRQFPQLRCDHSTKVRLGKVLRFLGCESKHTMNGNVYRLTAMAG